MKKLFLSLVVMLAATTAVFAQNEVDALRFSRVLYSGSARYWGLGGAYGAVGADLSALSTNPAGMGLYKRSEVSLTPLLNWNKAEGTYYNNFADDSKSSFTFGSAGAVFAIGNQNPNTNKDWKYFQFGFGYNQLANFNSNVLITGTNTVSSLMTDYVNRANGTAPADLGPFDTKLAYDANLIYRPNPNQNIYTADILGVSPFPGINQTKSVSTKGYLGETAIAGSANFQDKLYFGASLGIVSLRYEENSHLIENDYANKVPEFISFDKYDYQLIKGNGINLKLGVIYRAADWLRLGAALHTPTMFSKLNIDYNSSISSTFQTTSFNSVQNSPLGNYTFDLTTPTKFIGSAAFILGKTGLISVDYELLDYSNSRLSPSIDFTNENQRIKDKYTSASNIRVGGEYRMGQISLRGGYGYFGSPYRSGVNDGKGSLYTLGVGYRTGNYFVDCAYTNYHMTEDYYLYGTSVSNSASLKTTDSQFMVSVGLKF